ncbi:MAG: hypothetical protein KAS62_09000 [Candidatus Delongbacteria bacterium]|nr:hypothetical protein [Candidatus Delongbacteria bacterium]
MSADQKKILKKLKKSYKSNKKYYAVLADYLFKLGYDEQAQNLLEENNIIYAEYTSGKLVLGELFYSRKEYLKAEDMFKQVLELNKRSAKALKYLANIESLRKDKKAQFDYLNDVLRYDPFDQDAKNFILMYSGMYSDEKVGGSSYFSESLSELLDKDIVTQAIEGSNTYKSTYDLEELSKIAIEEKNKMENEERSNKAVPKKDEDVFKKDEVVELDRENSEIMIGENDIKQTIVIERDEPSELELSSDKNKATSDKELEEFEKELDDFKTKSSIEIPVPDVISEIFESSAESDEESQQFDPVDDRTPMKDIFSSVNRNIKMLNKFSILVEKVPDNIDFKGEFLLARSSFIKQRLVNEIKYYKKMSEKHPDNPKYPSKLRSFEDQLGTVDDYHLE